MYLSSSSAYKNRKTRYPLQAEINVTPLVDVMLVLLIVFMISAPLLNVGVPVNLPKTDAKALPSKGEPIYVSIRKDGRVYLQEQEVSLKELSKNLITLSSNNFQERLYIRADSNVDYGYVVRVMAHINTSGFSNLALVTDSLTEENTPSETINPTEQSIQHPVFRKKK